MTKFSKNLLLTMLSLIFAVCAIGIFTSPVNQVYAGEIYTTLVNEEFSSGSLDTKTWYNKGRFAGISYESTGNPKLVIKEGQGALDGSGINGKVAVNANNSLTFSIDFEELYFGARAKDNDCGWFALAYNLTSSDYKTANAYRVGQGLIQGDGICFTYTHDGGSGLVFTSLKGGVTFVDKNGNTIQQKGIYAYYPVDGLINDTEAIAIKDTKLIFTIDKNGNFACYKNEISNSNLLFKTSTMTPFKNGTYYGLTAHRSAVAIERTIINDFEVKCDDQVINSFDKSNTNKWNFYKQNETPEAYFSPKYYMHLGQDGDKIFTEQYPLFMSRSITFNDGEGSYAEFSTMFKINSIPDNSKIGFITGSKNYLKDKVGTENTTYIYVTNVGGEKYLGITTYDNNAVPTELLGVDDNVKLVANTNTGELSGYANLYANISETGEIVLLLNGSQVFASTEQDANCYASGYCGIAIEGSASNMDVAFSNITVKNSYYSRPTNINLNETFDNGGYNPNEFYFRQAPYLNSYTNTGGYVKDGKLWFDNLAFNTSFTTVYQYSDFEIQFDIDDIRREPIGIGNSKTYPISAFVGVYWGVPDSTSLFSDGVSTAYPLIYIATEVSEETWGKVGPTRIFAMGNGLNSCVALPDKYDYWDTKNEGKILQFKVSTVGNKVYVAVRYTTDPEGYWCTEDANGNPLTFTMREALVGNLAITTMGNNYYVEPHSVGSSCGYFSVDNLKITNKDTNASLTQSQYGTTYKELPTDFPYVKPDNDDDYLPVVGGSGCSSSASQTSLSIVAMLAFAAVCKLFIRRRKDD